MKAVFAAGTFVDDTYEETSMTFDQESIHSQSSNQPSNQTNGMYNTLSAVVTMHVHLLSRTYRTKLFSMFLILSGALGQALATPQAPSSGHGLTNVVSSAEIAKKGNSVLTGNWTLHGDLTLGGDAHITFRNAHVNLDGNLFLSGNAVLSIEDNSLFNLAQKRSDQYRMEAKENSTLKIADSEFQTNGGTADVLFYSVFIASDDASLILHNAHLDMKRNWFLGNFKDRAKLVSVNARDLPNEIYPADASTIQIEGKDTKAAIWLAIGKNQFAIFDDLPNTSQPYTWSFGRGQPAKTNVKYALEIKDAPVLIAVQSASGSDIKIVDNKAPISIGYILDGSTEPEVVNGLDGGTERTNLTITSGRKITIINSLIGGWQFYVTHSSQPITLTNSTINESATMDGGTIYAKNCKFLYGALGAVGKGAKFEADTSDIRSFSILSNNDGVVKIQNSTIHGSTIQASDDSRIILLNNDITTNANPYFGGANAPAHFIVQGKGSIIGLGIAPASPAQKGATIHFVGDIFVESREGLTGSYDLFYSKTGQGKLVPIKRGVHLNLHGSVVGTLNTKKLSAGSYLAICKVTLSDGTHFEVTRAFSIFSH